ncbi:MAG: hypothetical protein WCR46_25770 [Deltaproteobacteria bacterium]|jgi:hypothetical protein
MMDERQITSGIAAPQCGNYDGALVAAKTRGALGCGGPGMAPRYCSWYWDIYWRLTPFTGGS